MLSSLSEYCKSEILFKNIVNFFSNTGFSVYQLLMLSMIKGTYTVFTGFLFTLGLGVGWGLDLEGV